MNSEKSLKSKVASTIIIAIISGIIALLSLAFSIYAHRYTMIGIDQAKTTTHTFVINKTISQMETSAHWMKGKIYYGVNQTTGITGSNGTRYDIFYRRGNDPWIRQYVNGYVKKNNVYYGEWKMHTTNGKDKYGYKMYKRSYTDRKSVIIVDYILI